MATEFDEQLRSRLRAFQQHHGLADDGRVSAETWSKLAEVAYGASSASQTAHANAANLNAAPARDDSVAPDHRTDDEIARDLERRTHQTISELTIGLGLGPIVITPRELEARLIANGTLRRRLPDNSKHTVLDAVTERHPTMDGRFVTRGAVGTPESVDRQKQAGAEEHAAQLQQNLATLAGGMSGVRRSPQSPQSAGPKAAPKPTAPMTFDKVDRRPLGPARTANDHGEPTKPAAKVIPIRPPVEHEPRGEVMLDTGTGPARSAGEPVRDAARSGGGSRGVRTSPVRGTGTGGSGQQKPVASNPGPRATPKTRIPRTDGSWDSEPGNSEWVSFKPDVNRVTGSQGIPYRNGEPVLKKWATEKVIVTKMKGVNDTDFSSARQGMMNQYPGRWNSQAHVERWEKARQADNHGHTLSEAHTWHHEPDIETMSLVPTALHENVPHRGGASMAKSGGTPSRDAAPFDTNPL